MRTADFPLSVCCSHKLVCVAPQSLLTDTREPRAESKLPRVCSFFSGYTTNVLLFPMRKRALSNTDLTLHLSTVANQQTAPPRALPRTGADTTTAQPLSFLVHLFPGHTFQQRGFSHSSHQGLTFFPLLLALSRRPITPSR